MTKIKNIVVYNYDNNISDDDFLVGSDADTQNKETKSYAMGAVRQFLLSGLSPEVGGTLRMTEVVCEDELVLTPEAVLNALDPSLTVLQYHLVFVKLNGQQFLFTKQDIVVGNGEDYTVVNEDFIEFPVSVGPQGPQGEIGPKGDQGDQGLQGEDGLPGEDGADGVSVVASGTTTTVTGTGTELDPYKVEEENLQKTISTFPYTLTDADDKYTIFVDNSASNITINVPGTLKAKFACVFVQLGTGLVSFTGTASATLKLPTGYVAEIIVQNGWVLVEKRLTSTDYHLGGYLATTM